MFFTKTLETLKKIEAETPKGETRTATSSHLFGAVKIKWQITGTKERA